MVLSALPWRSAPNAVNWGLSSFPCAWAGKVKNRCVTNAIDKQRQKNFTIIMIPWIFLFNVFSLVTCKVMTLQQQHI
jgi:hypothetical protein